MIPKCSVSRVDTDNMLLPPFADIWFHPFQRNKVRGTWEPYGQAGRMSPNSAFPGGLWDNPRPFMTKDAKVSFSDDTSNGRAVGVMSTWTISAWQFPTRLIFINDCAKAPLSLKTRHCTHHDTTYSVDSTTTEAYNKYLWVDHPAFGSTNAGRLSLCERQKCKRQKCERQK